MSNLIVIDNKAVAKRVHAIVGRLRKYQDIAEIDMYYGGRPIRLNKIKTIKIRELETITVLREI